MKRKFTWDPTLAQSWKFTKPPGHPSPSELKIYEGYIRWAKKRPDARALILGSTPEIRDLCAKHKLPVTCVDYHNENFYILRTLMKRKGNEELVNQDWRKMKLVEKYDLIMGDVALQMIPLKDNQKILLRLQNALKFSGFLVHRNWIRVRGAYRTQQSVLAEYKRRAKKSGPFSALAMPMVQHCFDDKKGLVYYSQGIVDVLRQWSEKGQLDAKGYHAIAKGWSSYRMPNYLPTDKQFRDVSGKFFTINKIRQGNDWYKRFTPLYVLTAKSV